ncbi:hypothetical protein ACTD5D_00635 [Nocardia takedensis]|uniref:hypothetical protein n=1 Tax=Nocardia takedensis TaxID=259390 RepID=UPI0003079852|nr:hypothetical protein [Nocardia takedensis]
MTVPAGALVFDTGPLRHFSVQGWLGVLRFLAGERPVYFPDSVEGEYFLPFSAGGFRQHVLENGLLDYDEM